MASMMFSDYEMMPIYQIIPQFQGILSEELPISGVNTMIIEILPVSNVLLYLGLSDEES